jgi:DeoR family transcriptional regulator, fructose operon transcriptional repressor
MKARGGESMSSEQRYQKIIELIEEKPSVAVVELAAIFQVSEMTIRRDLASLEGLGLIHRTHGGAVSARGRSYEPPFLARSSTYNDEKARIGKAAAALVKTGDSIALDSGTTVLEVARELVTARDITVVTPSFQVAQVLADRAGIRLILTGGILRPGELSMIGDLTTHAFQELFVDKLFLGAAAVDIRIGLSEYNYEDSLVKRAMSTSAREVILVVDSSKFGQVTFSRIAPLRCVNKIVTDSNIGEEMKSALEREGIEVIVAAGAPRSPADAEVGGDAD